MVAAMRLVPLMERLRFFAGKPCSGTTPSSLGGEFGDSISLSLGGSYRAVQVCLCEYLGRPCFQRFWVIVPVRLSKSGLRSVPY